MTEKTDTLAELFGEVIHSYTRADALADGHLVDVSSTAAEAGFTFPVAVTRAVWAGCIEWTDADSERQTHQDEIGRLWDVVYMTAHHVRQAVKHNSNTDRATVELYRVPRDGHSTEAEPVELVAVIGPGDLGEPVITIMEPGED